MAAASIRKGAPLVRLRGLPDFLRFSALLGFFIVLLAWVGIRWDSYPIAAVEDSFYLVGTLFLEDAAEEILCAAGRLLRAKVRHLYALKLCSVLQDSRVSGVLCWCLLYSRLSISSNGLVCSMWKTRIFSFPKWGDRRLIHLRRFRIVPPERISGPRRPRPLYPPGMMFFCRRKRGARIRPTIVTGRPRRRKRHER